MIYFLLEERSMQRVLEKLLPQIIPEEDYEIKPHNGKKDLQIGIKKIVPTLSRKSGVKIVILHDQDNDDCSDLKNKLKSLSEKANCDVLIRIVCRELEAWFLGDMAAIERAYPKFKANKFRNKRKFDNVDEITKPSDHIKKMVPELRKYEVLPKLDVAEKISTYMDIRKNCSKSFNHFVKGLQQIITK